MPVGHLHIFFGEVPNQVLWAFLNWASYFILLSSWKSSFYIKNTRPLSDRDMVCKYFLLFSELTFYSLDVLWSANILNFVGAQFFFFSVAACASLRLCCQIQGHTDVPLWCFSTSFVFLSLIFRPLIHFELIFAHGVKQGPIHSSARRCPLWYHLLKSLFFLHSMILFGT